MARNFPDIWLGRVEKKLKATDQAPWLEGVSEIGGDPIMVGEGSDGEKCLIYIPTTEFEPGVLINNKTYPIALQEYTDDTVVIALDKYQTQVTTISDDSAMGATYDKVDAATKTHTATITSLKYKKAIHAIAPDTNTKLTPITKTTGGTDTDGRKKFTLKDLIVHKKAYDKAEIPLEGRRIVLCPDHVADLLEQDQKFRDQYYNSSTGQIAKLYGFEIYEYVANPEYNAETGAKKSLGAVPEDGDYQASVSFHVPNIGKKTGVTKQYFADSKTDPENQTNRLNYRHYFIATPKTARYFGAIVSDKA